MGRAKDIRETTKFYTDILIRNYEVSDPDRDDKEPINKTEVAAHTIEVWWQLYGHLVAWAQAHFTGYAALSHSPELVSWIEEKFQAELDEDDDLIEYIGWQYIPNRYFKENDLLVELDNLFEEIDFEPLTTPALRSLVIDLLLSRSANSSYWRFELQDSLRALNFGQSDSLSTPEKTRRQGEPYSLLQWKHAAILKLYFFMGQGMKKYVALEKIGDGIGQSPETLRTWEKLLLQDERFRFELWSAEVAGMYENELEKKSEIPSAEEMGMFRGTYMTEMAAVLLPFIKKMSFERIQEKLHFYRNAKSGA